MSTQEFLAELRDVHGDVAAKRASVWINGTAPARGRWRSWCGKPLLYTLAGRRNFFRSAFSHAMGELVEKPRLGHVAAVVGELTWTCTLMADDMIDGAAEREGRVAAHICFGTVRTSVSILFGLYVALHGLLFRPTGNAGHPSAGDLALGMPRRTLHLEPAATLPESGRPPRVCRQRPKRQRLDSLVSAGAGRRKRRSPTVRTPAGIRGCNQRERKDAQ